MSNQSTCSACGLVSLDIDLVRVGEGNDQIVMCPGCRSEGTMAPVTDAAPAAKTVATDAK